jgi:hypothetical protein
MMRYQESIENDMINEDGITNIPRPSIFYAELENLNIKSFQPCFRNVFRHFCRLWFCISGNTKYKRMIRKRASRFGINSRSKLDIFARIVFPVSFILLNILYWFYFLHFQR